MTTSVAADRVLDNPAWLALHGEHARFAQVSGLAARYHSDVAPFHALGDPADPRAWRDLDAFVPPGEPVLLAGLGSGPGPAGRWSAASPACSSSTCRCAPSRTRRWSC